MRRKWREGFLKPVSKSHQSATYSTWGGISPRCNGRLRPMTAVGGNRGAEILNGEKNCGPTSPLYCKRIIQKRNSKSSASNLTKSAARFLILLVNGSTRASVVSVELPLLSVTTSAPEPSTCSSSTDLSITWSRAKFDGEEDEDDVELSASAWCIRTPQSVTQRVTRSVTIGDEFWKNGSEMMLIRGNFWVL